MKKGLYYTLLAVLAGLFIFAAYKLGTYFLAQKQSQKDTQQAKQYMQVQDPQTGGETEEPAKITVDFEALKAVNEDIVAWIYIPGTKVNYPIVQASDNDYYLHRLLNGEYNVNGTIFMDYLNAPDFSDGNTLIYGHNMKSGYMFGGIVDYKKQSFYDEHPDVYLLTPDREYRLALFAGVVLEYDAEVYQTQLTDEYLNTCRSHSTFASDVSVSAADKIVTLSTCSYEYENARYVVMGKLVPVEQG